MAKLRADPEPGIAIDCLLLGRELPGGRPALRRTGPAGQLPVSLLRVLVAVSVHVLDSRRHALRLKSLQLLNVARRLWDQASADRELLGFVEYQALLCRANRNLALRHSLLGY